MKPSQAWAGTRYRLPLTLRIKRRAARTLRALWAFITNPRF